VLKENHRMLRMARDFGFTVHTAADGAESVMVDVSLTGAAPLTDGSR
jgi:hypothetical protein